MPRKPQKKGPITTKRVQATEEDPVELPRVGARPEIDDEEDVGDDGLNIRRRAFVDAITGPAFGNGIKAARMAGYSDSNRHVLEQTASRLLTFVEVQRAIRHRLASARLTAEWTRRAVADYAGASMADFLSVGPDGKPVMDWRKAAAAGAIGHVKEFKEKRVEGGGTITIVEQTFKIRDPMRAMELLARMHGLVDGGNGGEEPPRLRTRPVNRHADAGTN